MKRYRSIFTFLLLLALFLGNLQFLKAQNPFWTFPEQGLDVPDLLINSLPTDDYTGQEADYVHAGLKDPYSEIMFFMMDGRLYDASGTERSQFNDATVRGTSEALVVPQPGSCNRFYIFQGKPKGTGADSEFPYYSIYDDTLNILRPDQNNIFKTAWNMVSDPPELPNWGDSDHGVLGVHFAATRQLGYGVRWIFVSNNSRVYKVDLDCDGLSPAQWVYPIFTGPGALLESGWRSELEVYEDTADAVFRLAHPYFKQNTIDGNVKIAVFEVDSLLGDVISSSRIDIPFPNQPDESTTYVHGIEFSPNGEILYIVHDPFPNYPSPISYYDFNTSTLTNLSCTGVADFHHSQIQMAGDSGNYAMYFASEDYLGTLSDPDNPSCSNWNPTSIAFSGGYSSNFGGAPIFRAQDDRVQLPRCYRFFKSSRGTFGAANIYSIKG